MRAGYAVILATLVAAPAFGQPYGPRDRKAAILATNAVIDTSDDAVVGVGLDAEFKCSGVLIAPRIVLTARHCLPANIVAFGKTLAAPDRRVSVVAAKTPEDATLDAAVLLLAECQSTTMKVSLPQSQANPPLGELRLVGFGTVDPKGEVGFGTKRMTTVVASGWGCDEARMQSIGCIPSHEMVIGRYDGRDTCPGDSGGPVFRTMGRRVELVALTSRGIPGPLSCGNGGIYTRVDSLLDFVVSVRQAQLGEEDEANACNSNNIVGAHRPR